MTIDSEQELNGLKRIGRIVGLALKEMKKNVRPGITTAELDGIGAAFLQKHGARSAPRLVYQFPGETCISINDEAAHGIPGDRVIQAGDLVNIDVSAELDGYFADSAITVLVPPATSAKQKLCRCAQGALYKAIGVARADAPINLIGKTIETEAHRCGFSILRDLSGHGVGRNIHEEPHDVSNYFNRFDRRRLSKGMVITIEPFMSNGADHVIAQQDGWTLKTANGGLSAQYEHTIVITHSRPIVVTAV